MSTATVTPQPGQPIEIKLGDGSVIKGANLEEAIQNAAKRVEDNVTAYRSEKQKREEAEAEAARLRHELEAKTPPTQTDGFAKDRYYQLLNEDPIAAQNYMDQHRFGVNDPVAAFNGMRQSVDAIQQQAVAAAFSAIHSDDFPATPEAARALTQRTEQLVGQGFRYGIETVNYAYDQLVREGTIKPLEKVDDAPLTPNPSLTGTTGNAMPDDVARAEQMSDADLEKLLRSRGVLR